MRFVPAKPLHFSPVKPLPVSPANPVHVPAHCLLRTAHNRCSEVGHSISKTLAAIATWAREGDAHSIQKECQECKVGMTTLLSGLSQEVDNALQAMSSQYKRLVYFFFLIGSGYSCDSFFPLCFAKYYFEDLLFAGCRTLRQKTPH